ncbi:MAG: pyridoxal-dependent decarboxylase [Nitriliruptor sp.]
MTDPLARRTAPPHAALDPGQLGTGDMDPDSFRRHGHEVIDWIADYLEGVGERRVLSDVAPGDIAAALPAAAPEGPEAFAATLEDLERVILPGVTHWNHPAFHAYFAITGSGPGILAEALSAALNVNGMLWRTSPAATELEERTLDWLRQMLGLAADWRGVLTDTASVSTLVALAAARERADLDVRNRGMAGRPDLPPLRIYTSSEAHSSVEKAAITLGLGRDGVRLVPVDGARRLDVGALRDALEEDIRLGSRPIAIVATTGTTSTTSIDPVAAIADLRDEVADELGHPIWLHVDGAYGGVAAICDELRWVLDGVDRADSFVTNPHKWLFTPIDCSALYVRDVDTLTRTFSLIPEYLTTDDEGVTDYMEWGVQLGRRFRSLKLWAVLRYFGRDGLAERIRSHVAQAQQVVRWVEEHPHLELAAPAPLSTVCFRSVLDGEDETQATARNRAWLAAINATGEAYLSHTVLDERYVLRLALGNLRTTDERLATTLELLERELTELLP